jgi:pimeloyl-ACP methyl ester carboxylesterase
MKRAILILAAVVAACGTETLSESQAFPTGTPFRAQYRVIDGTRLRMIDTGRGPAVVFIHGLSASMYAWRYQLAPVLAAGHRVIAFDNRGFGFSERPDTGYTNADYARLVVALLDSLGVGDAVLVGHSMGGAIALETTLLRPDRVRGLVLIGPAGLLPRAVGMLRSPVIGGVGTQFVTRATVSATLRSCFADPRRVREADIDQYYAPFAVRGARSSLRHVLRAFRFDGVIGRLDSIQVPTLVMWGAADNYIPFAAAADIAQGVQRSAFIVVPDAGHNAQEEQHDEVTRSLIAFLQHGLPETPPDLAANRSSSGARSTPLQTRDD